MSPNEIPTAPILLFCYSRPRHLRATINSLAKNHGANTFDLIVFSDAPGLLSHEKGVSEVRRMLSKINGFRSVNIHERPYNYGLSRSIVEGVTQVLKEHDRVIILEDDMVTSPYFLRYMSQALAKFSDQDEVACVHGYVYPIKKALPEAFFLPGADCWGWGTWRRAWKIFNPDGSMLLRKLRTRDLIDYFDYNRAFPYSKMLEDQIKGKNDSWAIRWYASTLLAGKLTLYPGRSLVHNIGNDSSGVHSGGSTVYDTEVSDSPISLESLRVEVNSVVRAQFEEYLRESRWGQRTGILHRLSRLIMAAKNAVF